MPEADERIRFYQLTFTFTALAVVTSRITLVLHEFVGHAAAVVAQGGAIGDFRLYAFGGGWVSYCNVQDFTTNNFMVVSLAGVGVELLVALIALAVASRLRIGTLLSFGLTAGATVLLIHTGFYLSMGIHYGYGDGTNMHSRLGAERGWVVGLVSLAVVVTAYLLARAMLRQIRPWFGGVGKGKILFQIGLAVLIAIAVHGGLAWAEQRVCEDGTYSLIMEDERDREVAREVAVLREAAEADGQKLGKEELRQIEQVVAARVPRPFPLRPILIGALVIVFGLAFLQMPEAGTPFRPDSPALMRLAMVLASTILVVLFLRTPWFLEI